MVAVVELVLDDLTAERVAVYAEDMRGAGLVAVGAIQNTLNEALFEFPHSFVEEDAAFHHLADKSFQLILHVGTLQKKNT
jgi:hypothetical protein